LLDDNPYLDRAEYVETLQELHPTHWRRILYGDWDAADPGEMFQPRVWLDANDWLDVAPSRVAARARYWDLAASEPGEANPDPDWTAGARVSRTVDGFFVVEHIVRIRQTPAAVERLEGREDLLHAHFLVVLHQLFEFVDAHQHRCRRVTSQLVINLIRNLKRQPHANCKLRVCYSVTIRPGVSGLEREELRRLSADNRHNYSQYEFERVHMSPVRFLDAGSRGPVTEPRP
jgi:hypothetical protein